jgi:hypothetical protein
LKLESLQTNAAVRGVVADSLVTVVRVKWYGTDAVELPSTNFSRRIACGFN